LEGWSTNIDFFIQNLLKINTLFKTKKKVYPIALIKYNIYRLYKVISKNIQIQKIYDKTKLKENFKLFIFPSKLFFLYCIKFLLVEFHFFHFANRIQYMNIKNIFIQLFNQIDSSCHLFICFFTRFYLHMNRKQQSPKITHTINKFYTFPNRSKISTRCVKSHKSKLN